MSAVGFVTPEVTPDPLDISFDRSFSFKRAQVLPNFVLLFGQATGQSKFEMEALSASKFTIRVVGAEIDFVVDDKGAVNGLVLHQGGRDTPGKRLP